MDRHGQKSRGRPRGTPPFPFELVDRADHGRALANGAARAATRDRAVAHPSRTTGATHFQPVVADHDGHGAGRDAARDGVGQILPDARALLIGRTVAGDAHEARLLARLRQSAQEPRRHEADVAADEDAEEEADLPPAEQVGWRRPGGTEHRDEEEGGQTGGASGSDAIAKAPRIASHIRQPRANQTSQAAKSTGRNAR